MSYLRYHVVGHAVRLDDHVVHIDFGIQEYLSSVHEPLECGPYLLQFKGHDPVTKIGIISDEGGFFLIRRVHPNQVIP